MHKGGTWTATPALIKVDEIGQNKNTFECKRYSKLVQYSGKRHIVPVQLSKQLPKRPFFIATPQLRKQWIKVKPYNVHAKGPPLSALISFVRIDPVDWTLSGYTNLKACDSIQGEFFLFSVPTFPKVFSWP